MNGQAKLFRTKELLDTKTTDSLFLRAVAENCRFHSENCTQYRAILDYYKFSADSLQEYALSADIPPIPALLSKKHKMFSMPPGRILIKATSPGTKGKLSQIGFEAGALLCGLKKVLKVAKFRKLFSLRPANYVVFGCRPKLGNRTAVTNTAFWRNTLYTCPAQRLRPEQSGRCILPNSGGCGPST